jgi:hypothetical protein
MMRMSTPPPGAMKKEFVLALADTLLTDTPALE